MSDFLYVLFECYFLITLWIQFCYGLNTLEGYTVVLKCPYKANVGKRLSWHRITEGSSLGYAINDKINTQNLSPDIYERLTVSGNHAAGEYNLNISNTRESDQGTYECSISGTADSYRQHVIVIDAPSAVKIKNASPDNRIKGTEGQIILLQCTAVGGELPPDVKLYIAETNVANGKQSVQHTMIFKRSHDGQIVKCIAGYEEFSHYLLTNSSRIYINMKPLPPTFIPYPVSTEETVPLVVSCISHGSRPAATIAWLIGRENSNITSHSAQKVVMNSTTDTYIITSTLTYSIDRSYDKQAIKCTASNIASTNSEVSTSTYLIIKYPPDITVDNYTFHQSDLVRNITCIAKGNPSTYTYYTWIHFSSYHVKIREMQGSHNGVLTLPSLSEELSYQDNGLYLCTASNGIIDKDGKTKQASYGFVKTIAYPVFSKESKLKIYGEIGKRVILNVYVYSEPKYTKITWHRNGTRILNSAKYSIKDEITIIDDRFHGTDIQIDGYKISLIIEVVRKNDFTNYNLRLSNGIGKPAEHTLHLVHGSAPQTPMNFTVISVKETSLTVYWKSADNGGYQQTFYVEYKVLTSSFWLKKEVPTIMYADENQVYELFRLHTSTYYNLRIFAVNKINKSLPSITLTTQTLKSDTSNDIGNSVGIIVFAVGISCMLLTVVSLLVLGLIYYRRRTKFKTKRNEIESTGIPLDNRIEDTDKAKSTSSQNDQHCYDETTIVSYESLGVKDEPRIYKELNRNVTDTSWRPETASGVKDKPNIYSEVKA